MTYSFSEVNTYKMAGDDNEEMGLHATPSPSGYYSTADKVFGSNDNNHWWWLRLGILSLA